MNVVIVHGSNPNDKEKLARGEPPQNKRHWIPWVKEKLEKKGIDVVAPHFPTSWCPNYSRWKKEFEKLKIDDETIIVAASAGGAFVVRWLGETKKKRKELILIVPAKIPSEDNQILKEFYNFKIDESIKERVDEIVFFVSDNDTERMRKSAKFYYEKLGGKWILKKGWGHYMEEYMKTKEFPELLNEILK